MATLMYTDTFYLTPLGLERFKREKAELLEERSTKSREEEEEILSINSRLNEIQRILRQCRLLELPPEDERHVVSLGATVTLSAGRAERTITIVGTLEADTAVGRVSNESPVGRALLGSAVGDTVTIPGKEHTLYVVKEVRYDL